jgi:dienelactone hydrolase
VEDDMSEVQSKRVEYGSGEARLKGFMAWDGDRPGQRPGILVVHEWWGCNDYVRRRAEMLAELGYAALAVDMYGEGRTADNPDEAGALMGGLVSDLNTVRDRFDAALEFLRAQDVVDAGRVGGGIVLHMARYGRDLKAVASFHGSLSLGVAPEGEGAEVTARVAAYHGEADVLVDAETAAAFRKEMAKTGADFLWVSLPCAYHGFSNPQATPNGEKYGLPLRYDERADRASWNHLQLVLESVFG